MKEYLLVGFGGMFGSMLRYASSTYFLHSFPNSKFPWGTFFVNILGCLLIGLIAGLAERLVSSQVEVRLAIITGLLGGFTTFSAFGLESLHLLKEGAYGLALGYILSSIILGILFAYLGLRLVAAS